MKVVLIAPPWIFKEEVEFLSQNLGLGYLGSYLENQGHDVIIIDAFLEGINKCSPFHTKYADVLRWGLSDEEIVRLIPADAEIIGMTAPFADSKFTVNPLSMAIKRSFPVATIVMGGMYPSSLPEEAIRLSGADILVIGEGEIALSKIAAGEEKENIKGLIFRKGDRIIKTGKSDFIKNLDDIPMMSYFDLRPMERYVEWSPWGNKIDKTLALLSSRGCPFHCTFCSGHSVYEKLWRPHSSERVLREMKTAIEKFGVDHIEFQDDNFSLQKNRATEILKGIRDLKSNKGERIFWSAPNGLMIDSLDKELIAMMKESGAETIYLPVESGDENILRLMRKPFPEKHLAKTMEVIRNCAEAGIQAGAFIIVGYPGEDKKSFEKTLDFCRKILDLGLNAIAPLVATPYPNTELFDLCRRNGWLVYPDIENALIYQRYSNFLPEFVQIDSPLCSKEEAYERHRKMMEIFPTKHNIRK